jgi:hypothetical protein
MAVVPVSFKPSNKELCSLQIIKETSYCKICALDMSVDNIRIVQVYWLLSVPEYVLLDVTHRNRNIPRFFTYVKYFQDILRHKHFAEFTLPCDKFRFKKSWRNSHLLASSCRATANFLFFVWKSRNSACLQNQRDLHRLECLSSWRLAGCLGGGWGGRCQVVVNQDAGIWVVA